MRQYNFVERSIWGALSFLKDAVVAEEVAERKGLLQALDPRVKTISLLAFLLTALFLKSIAVLAVLYIFCLGMAVLSRIGLWSFLKRTWVFIPLFSLLIALPALFSSITPGAVIGHIGPAAITRQGVLGAGLFLSRVVVSVSLALLLSLTTRHFELLKVMRVFGVPQMFVMVLGMCIRYIILFVEILEQTHRAIQSRVGRVARARQGRHLVAWNIASLWNRSYRLNEQVYLAMLSRGYRGEPVLLRQFKARRQDWLWLAGTAAVVCFLFAGQEGML